MPIDVVMGLPPDEENVVASTHDYLEMLQNDASDACRLARERLCASAERRKRYYDLKVKAEQFEVGDWVYYYYPRRRRRDINIILTSHDVSNTQKNK